MIEGALVIRSEANRFIDRPGVCTGVSLFLARNGHTECVA